MRLLAGIRIALSLSMCMTLTGCWDYQRINNRGPIFAIGVDPGGDQGNLKFTIQVPLFDSVDGQSESESSGASSTREFKNYTVDAQSVDEAVALAQMQSQKQFYFGNLQVVVLNSQLKKRDVMDVVEELIRNPQVDKLAHLVTTTEDARTVLQPANSAAPSDKLDQILGPQLRQHEYTTRERLWEFWRDAISVGVVPATPVAVIEDTGVSVEGSYVYRGMEPAMPLTPDQTKAMNIIDGRLSRAILNVEMGKQRFTVGNLSAHNRTHIRREGSQFVIENDISVRGTLFHEGSRDSSKPMNSSVTDYEKALATQIRDQSETLMHTLQDERLDVFGYGRLWLILHPSDQRMVENDWSQAFQNAKVTWKVSALISRKGTMM